MTIAAALFLFAVGAILKFAISAEVSWVDLGVIGIILMVVGGVGFVIAMIMTFSRRHTDVVSRTDDGYGAQQTRTTYTTPTDPNDPYT